MTTPTPQQLDKLKLALARMLPEELEIFEGAYGTSALWRHRYDGRANHLVLQETEMLHIVGLCEAKLTREQVVKYAVNRAHANLHAPVLTEYLIGDWPTRAIALLSL
jgi:hypothetical protein